MSTRSSIGIVNKDGTITTIYCHHDGYIEYNGRILDKYYTSENIVRELINNGDLSTLKIKITPEKDKPHNFDDPQINICVYYHRDRKEKWEDTKPITYKTTTAWLEDSKNAWIEYLYLFRNGKWYYTEVYQYRIDKNKKISFKELKKAITKLAI